MPLLVAVVPPEWHMWGYNPKKFSARFARSIFVPPTLKIVAPPLAAGCFGPEQPEQYLATPTVELI